MAALLDKPPRRRRRPRRPSLAQRPATSFEVFVFEHERFLWTELFSGRRAIVVGRHPSADLRLDADTVSRQHASLSLEGGVIWVRDLGSANGTWLGSRRIIGRTALSSTSVLTLGSYAVRVRSLVPSTARGPIDWDRGEAVTRLEAVLGVEHPDGTQELPIDLGEATPHLRLIEAARARQPERSYPPRMSRAVPQVPSIEPPTAAPRTADKLGVHRRARDLDAVIARLDDRPQTRLPWTEEAFGDVAERTLRFGDREGPCAGPSAPSRTPSDALGPPTTENPQPPAPNLAERQKGPTENPLGWGPVVSAVLADGEVTGTTEVNVRHSHAQPHLLAEDFWTDPLRVPRRPIPAFKAVEIIAERVGEILAIAELGSVGQQYVLGHSTPQGDRAPYDCHEGLRLLRLQEGLAVDLVFPQGVIGHVRRGRRRVDLADLTEGRKYSCLRLEHGDVVALRLDEDPRSITYRIRFRP